MMPLTALLPATRAPNPADLFEGVPDVVAPTAGVDEPVVDADEEAARAVAREAQRKFEEEQDAQALEEEEAEMEAEMEAEDATQYSGKRKIIKHTLPPDMIVGVDPTSAEELAKRAARAAKFMAETCLLYTSPSPRDRG